MIVEPPDWPLWLGETEGDAASLLHPAAEDTLLIWPVSTRVNRPANTLPICSPRSRPPDGTRR